MRSAQQCTNVLFLSSFIDTVLKSGFSNLGKSDTRLANDESLF